MTVDEAKEKWCCMGKMRCTANTCMAWRWHQARVSETFLNEDGRLEYKPRTGLSKMSGYCGLAGKEGAE